jgi:molybdate transport system ATP-binding protein
MKPATASRAFLCLQDAAFRLGDRIVFEQTSWDLRRDEHWAVVGANGSGKSLLGDALRGRLPLVQGELRYQFRPPHGLTPEDSIGHVAFEDRKADVQEMVVQSRWNSLEEEGALLVREFLEYGRVMEINPFEVSSEQERLRPQFERRRDRAAALLRVGPFLDRRLISLSNGERQRVQLARALSRPLRLLILDEPFVGMDATNREHFHSVLEALMDTALRVLLITTRVEDLPRHITHVLRVDQCRVVSTGPRAEVLKRSPVGRALRCAPRRLVGRAGPSAPSSTSGAQRSARPTLAAVNGASAGMRRPGRGVPIVAMRNVTVRYGDSVILENINWTVRRGESWALLGPNGSGKTTLLSLILGDNPQVYTNDIAVFGRPRGSGQSIWGLRRRIGWVSPELHLHFSDAATCFEVAASGFRDTIGLFEPPTSRQRGAVRRWLQRFQVLEYASAPLFSLSMGLQRTVLLARALVKDPPLLILDEPCQGLDPAHRAFFVRLVNGLIRSGAATVIYVSHRSDEIPPAIRRVLHLSHGRASV